MRCSLLLLLLRFLACISADMSGSQETQNYTVNVTTEVLADELKQVNILDLFGQGIQKELQTVKQPIDETIINIGSSTCERVQKLLGMSYEQMKDEGAPNMDTLTLVYKTKYFTTILNITTAAEGLRRLRPLEPDQRLILYLHGFTDNPTKEGFANLTRSFFAADGQEPEQIHVIGHSLGAHIAGATGKAFLAATGRLLGRVTGLDPAGPCFSHVRADMRLKHTDAAYVDVIHTDAGVYGLKDAIGHKDFYPNSGAMQPNCLTQSCSHSRSWLLYGESVIYPQAFPAVKCQDWEAFKSGDCEPDISYMGYASNPEGSTGRYFLQTLGDYPYGLGMSGIKYRNTEGMFQNIGKFFG